MPTHFIKPLILLFLGSLLLTFGSSCKKEPKKGVIVENKKHVHDSSLAVIATAHLILIDDKKTSSFNGYQKSDQYTDPNGKIGGVITERKNLKLFFINEYGNEINIELGVEDEIQTGIYDIKNHDNVFAFSILHNKIKYDTQWIYGNFTYDNNPIILKGQLEISKLTETSIKGSFYFESYGYNFTKKAAVESGEFEADILRQ